MSGRQKLQLNSSWTSPTDTFSGNWLTRKHFGLILECTFPSYEDAMQTLPVIETLFELAALVETVI